MKRCEIFCVERVKKFTSITMKVLITVVALFQLSALSAQFKAPEFRVVLYSGEILDGSQISYQSALLRPAVFLLDNQEFVSHDVGFFQNAHGYFANLGKIHGENTERYAMRIKKGKMNLYEEIDISVYGEQELATLDESGQKVKDPMLASGESFNYYNMNNTPMREARYDNLKVDIGDNANSALHLKKYRNYRWLQWSMLGAGSGVIAYEIIRNSGSAIRLNPFMAFGIVIGGSSYFLEAPKDDELWLAADEYNKDLPATANNPH